MTRRPVISYITVVRNAVNEIRKTVESVTRFRSPEVEYVVVDGASNDGTREWLYEHHTQFDVLVSENDNGIYDAMNKGIHLAKGLFVCFINVGDQLLQAPVAELEKLPANTAAAAFAVQLSDGRKRVPRYDYLLRWENTLHHQGLYYRKDLTPLYDTRYKVFADFNLNQQLWLAHKVIALFPGSVNASHELDGMSNSRKHFSELFQVIRNNFGSVQAFAAKLYFRLKYGLLRRITQNNR